MKSPKQTQSIDEFSPTPPLYRMSFPVAIAADAFISYVFPRRRHHSTSVALITRTFLVGRSVFISSSFVDSTEKLVVECVSYNESQTRVNHSTDEQPGNLLVFCYTNVEKLNFSLCRRLTAELCGTKMKIAPKPTCTNTYARNRGGAVI